MPRCRAAVVLGDYTGDVYYTRNFFCCVKRLDGSEWRGYVQVMSAANANTFMLGMVVQAVQYKLQLPDDRTLLLDPFFHSDIWVPFSLLENQVAWYFIEHLKSRVFVLDTQF